MSRTWILFICVALVALGFVPRAHSIELSHFAEKSAALCCAVAAKRGGLAYTRQLFCNGDEGGRSMIRELAEVAESCNVSLQEVAKLNLFVADSSQEKRREVEAMLEEFWPSGRTPAVTFIPGALPSNAQMGCDAVIALGKETVEIKGVVGEGGQLEAVVAPADCDLVYASGRVGKGATYSESIPAAMEVILEDYLSPLGCQAKEVLQVRIYLHDLDQCSEAEALIAEHFPKGRIPPIVVVEWAREGAVEIEVIAAAPPSGNSNRGVSFFTPPQFEPSPAFSRVAILHGREIVFLSGMEGNAGSSNEEEVHSLFAAMQTRVEAVGSDMSHLVKASYMVSESEMDQVFSKLRLQYLDPERPPAASKVFRSEVGIKGARLLVDLIATKSGADR